MNVLNMKAINYGRAEIDPENRKLRYKVDS